MPKSSSGRSSGSDDFLNFVARTVPPAFTVPVLALKAFIPSLQGVFVLGSLLAIGMFFQNTTKKWYERISLAATCFAWLLIIDEVGANEILNRYIMGNSVDDHTYVIRFLAGAFVILNSIAFGFYREPSSREPPSTKQEKRREQKNEDLARKSSHAV